MDAPTSDAELQRLRDELGDQYALVRLIGRGGMGAVYLARERSLDRLVALKVLPASADDETTRERFRREARMVARLNHPAIVPLYAYGETARTLYYAMAYIDGESLAQRLKREGPLSSPETRELLASVAAALDHAHRRGLIHRDIKPSNIMIDGESGRILVTDFGIGRALGSPPSGATEAVPTEDAGPGLTRVGEAIGTPRYMAPEQATGAEVDARTDLYALGLTAYEAAAGRAPFEGQNPQALLTKKLMGDFEPLGATRPDVDPRVAALVERCLAGDPDERPQTAERVMALLADDAPPSAAGLDGAEPLAGGRGVVWGGGRWMALTGLALVAVVAWAWNGFMGLPRDGSPREAVYSDPDVPLLIARLREAIFSGSLDEAEALVDGVVAAPDITRERTVQLLRHAARDFVQADAPDRARRAVDHMLDVEPPLVMLHPAVEPPELMEIYGAARRARASSDRLALQSTAPLALDPDSVFVSVGAISVTGFEAEDRANVARATEFGVVDALVPAVRVVERSMLLALAEEFASAEPGEAGLAAADDGPDLSAAVNDADRFYIAYEAAMAGAWGTLVPETHIVYGSVGVSGDRVLVGLWAVSVEDATVVGFAQAEGTMPDGLLDAVEQASSGLLERLGVG